MNILELFANTFTYQLPDGRFIFRPWGKFGPCYLLAPNQRTVRTWSLIIFYALAIAPFWIVHDINPIIYFFTFVALNYFLYWLFSLGLPITENPPTPTPEQRRNNKTKMARKMGRPMLWMSLTLSWLFILAGFVSLLFGEVLTSAMSIAFFSLAAIRFSQLLKLTRDTDIEACQKNWLIKLLIQLGKLTLALTFGITIILAILFFWGSTGVFSNQTFNKKEWLTPPANQTDFTCYRGGMAMYIKKFLLKENMPKNEVITLLGKPNIDMPDHIEYTLGMCSGLGIDYDGLIIEFDENDKFTQAFIVQH